MTEEIENPKTMFEAEQTAIEKRNKKLRAEQEQEFGNLRGIALKEAIESKNKRVRY